MKIGPQLPGPLSKIRPEYPHLVNYSLIDESLQPSLFEAERRLEASERRMAQLEEQGFRPLRHEENIAWAHTIADAARR